MPLDELLPNDLQAPREARQAVARFLARADLPQLIDDAQLLVSEVVTNAVRHARGPIAVHAHVRDGFLHLEVGDSQPELLPERREARAEDESGRGMELVDKLSARWGWKVTERSKVIWFDLRV
ncbi:MAG: ATP-binding protein [Candidatus Nanopelagicales bacterium]|jgi:anti-sigma regulatory factor (Ser/Thr protein kinase)|nr:ATP-binding protein [Candidatus Nanopelagicales bacterium]